MLALEALPARQVDARIPSVVSFGAIHGGVRYNIIPDQVELAGTIRALAPEVREQLHERIRRTARAIAEGAGATAEVEIDRRQPDHLERPGSRRAASARRSSVSRGASG